MNDTFKAQVHSHTWFQKYDIKGVETPGVKDVYSHLAAMEMPESFRGMRVLDIGANDGFFSFEAERRGAAEVVAFDHPDWGWAGTGADASETFLFARDALSSDVRPVKGTVEKLALYQVGGVPFDVVFFMGVLYHLEEWHGPLRKIRRLMKTGGLMILETMVACQELDYPAMRVIRSMEYNNDPTNYAAPNDAAVSEITRRCGFRLCRKVGEYGGDRAVYHVNA